MRACGLRLSAGMLVVAAGLVFGIHTAPSAAQGGKVEDLFNGKNLEGWYTFLPDDGKNKDPLGIFKVENGMIHVSGQKFGYLSTEKEHGNYRLRVDFKWGQKK